MANEQAPTFQSMFQPVFPPVFQIQRSYLKEASLEQPNSPAILLEQAQPTVDVQLGVGAETVAEGIFEVIVTATVQTKIKDKTVFLVEATQAGIFEIRHVPESQMGAILGVTCPQLVYLTLRANVADLIQRGGFPPIHLSEINFQALYEQQKNPTPEATASAPAEQPAAPVAVAAPATPVVQAAQPEAAAAQEAPAQPAASVESVLQNVPLPSLQQESLPPLSPQDPSFKP